MRPAHCTDIAGVRKTIAEAFATDPLLLWIFDDPQHRHEMSAAWLGLFVEAYVASGRVDIVEVAGEVVAAALWRPPDQQVAMPEAPTVLGLLAAFIGTERGTHVAAGMKEFARVRPAAPFVYLHFLAVAPTEQHRGLGREVIRPCLTTADTLGVGVALETTNSANLGFYESFGFKLTEEFSLGAGGPRAWAMFRAAAA